MSETTSTRSPSLSPQKSTKGLPYEPRRPVPGRSQIIRRQDIINQQEERSAIMAPIDPDHATAAFGLFGMVRNADTGEIPGARSRRA